MGGTKFVYEIAKRLKKKCDIDIYVHKSSCYVQNRFKEIDCPLINISHVSSDSKKYWLLVPYYVRADVKALRKVADKYDVFLATYFPMNWVATRLNKRAIYFCYEPFVWFHDPAARAHMSWLMKSLVLSAKLFYKHYDLEGTRKCESVSTLSDFVSSRIAKIYGIKAIVAGEGVDTDFFVKKHDPALRQKYAGFKVILHYTNYGYTKRSDFLLEALPKVKQKVRQVKLLIMSTVINKQAKKGLVRRAKELGVYQDVVFLPFLEEEMLPYYYSLADVVVQPSLNEAASLPIKEAMACETPVIGSFGDGSEEDIGDSGCGFLVHQGNVNELAKCIIAILNKGNLAELMAKKGRKRVLELFSWNKVVDVIWQAIYKKESD